MVKRRLLQEGCSLLYLVLTNLDLGTMVPIFTPNTELSLLLIIIIIIISWYIILNSNFDHTLKLS